jgi:subtilisin family serine protease
VEAWSALESISGSVTVAVVDTGIDNTHPDLAGRIAAGGRNFVATRSDGASYSPEDASDDHGHGTHVAGIISAVYGNGRGVAGVAGPAPVLVLPVKVLNDQGRGTSFALGQGITYAADQGAEVINLSLGGSLYSRFEAAGRSGGGGCGQRRP